MIAALRSVWTAPRVRPAVTGILALVAILTWGELFVRLVWPVAVDGPWRNPASWVATRLALEGKPDLMYAGPDVFAAESRRLGATPDIFEANPPPTIIPYLPLALFSVNAARGLWELFSFLCFAAAWLLLLWAGRPPPELALLSSALVPLFQPLRFDLLEGQAYTPALLLAVAGTVLASRVPAKPQEANGPTGDFPAGAVFGVMAIFRSFYGAFLLLPALAGRRWRVAAGWLAVYGPAALATLAWLGPGTWGTYLDTAATWRGRPETAVTAYQGVNNILAHLLRYDARWNPAPLADLPWLADALYWVLVLAIMAVSAAVLWRAGSGPLRSGSVSERWLPYALAASTALLITPIAGEYHFVLSILPLFVAAWALLEHVQQAPLQRLLWAWAIAVCVAALLIGWPFRYYNVPGADGWAAFLFYPRLYGNLILWATLLLLIRRRQKEPGT